MDEFDDPIDPCSPPIRRLVDIMLAEAVAEESRQILIAVASDRFTVCLLRDNEWSFRDKIPRRVFPPLVGRLQMLAGTAGKDTFAWTHPDGSEFFVHVAFSGDQTILTLELHKS